MFEINEVTYSYPSQQKSAISNISLSVGSGEVVLLAGPNGGGKSTLLKAMTGIVPKAYGGEFSGKVLFNGQSVSKLTIRDIAGQIGVVLQDPERQITHMTVMEELVFGPCNLLFPKDEVLDRAQQALRIVGMSKMEQEDILSLSGGELQRISIACMLAMRPKVLILDEPITSLDPFGVAMVIETLKNLSGYVDCIVIASHWIDPFLDLITRIIVVSQGQIVGDINSNDIGDNIDLFVKNSIEIPERVRLGNVYDLLSQHKRNSVRLNTVPDLPLGQGIDVVSGSGVSFSFAHEHDILHGLNIALSENETFVLAGRNGSGKSTLARMLLKLIKPKSGVLNANYNTSGFAPQKPSLSFLGSTVLEEMSFGVRLSKKQIEDILELFGLTIFINDSPHILSGGLQRRLSLAVNFARNPDFLVLDEPTAGLDVQGVTDFLVALNSFSGTVLHITHDMRIVSQSDTHLLVIAGGKLFDVGNRSRVTSMQIKQLGYDLTSETVALACSLNAESIPMKPEEVEVYNADLI